MGARFTKTWAPPVVGVPQDWFLQLHKFAMNQNKPLHDENGGQILEFNERWEKSSKAWINSG